MPRFLLFCPFIPHLPSEKQLIERYCCVQVITITSRYVLFNNSSEPLQYGQRSTNLVWQLAPGVKAPFHWDDADGRFELCVRPAQGKWNWSGAFEVSPVVSKTLHSIAQLACLCGWHLGADQRW